MVIKSSPAALAGLRFGDQILQINGTTVAGYSVDDVHKLLRKSNANNISVVIRDRPFERTVTLHKDSTGCVGFQFKNGKIVTIVKDSSAARNGLLIDHQLLEVDGQNVVSFAFYSIVLALIKSLSMSFLIDWNERQGNYKDYPDSWSSSDYHNNANIPIWSHDKEVRFNADFWIVLDN